MPGDGEDAIGPDQLAPLLSPRRQVRLAMVDAIASRLSIRHLGLRSNDLDFDGMHLTVKRGRSKRQAVFMTHELRDLCVNRVELFCIRGEIGAASRRFGQLP